MRIFRYHTLWVIVLAIFGVSHVVQGAILTHAGIYPGTNPSNVQMDVQVTNDNAGAIYNSADLNVTQQLALDLWSLPVNSNNADPNWNGYSTIDEMIADWGVSISGEVQNGWNGTPNTDGSFSMTKSGAAADSWYSSSVFPSQDMQFYTLNIPKSQLELDGIAGYNPATDASIVLSGEGNTIPDAFTAYEGSIGQYQTEGQYFQVQVPEVSSSALVMGGLAAIVAGFRRRLSRSVLPFVA